MKNSLERVQEEIWEGWRNSQLDKLIEVIYSKEQKEEKMKKNEQSPWDL